jgi:glycosyltransferase involved in cell wall biosynthesis
LFVTHEGVSPLFFGATPLSGSALERLGIRSPYVIAVGTLEPRKNLERLLGAWRAVRASAPDWQLVLAGPKGWGPTIPETPGVALTGWVGDETLPGLLAAAEAFCYPSLYEGFGLPPLEAMAAGVPGVVARYSAAEEVIGEGALLVEPTDVESLARALLDLIEDEALRNRLRLSGRARAAGYTWGATALATLAAYQAALS